MTVTAHLDPPSVSVEPGGEQHVTMHLHNSGDIVESYRLEVVGASSPWAVVEPATLSVFPGSTESAVVTFRPPRSSEVPSDEQPFAIRVLPSERPDRAVVPEGTVRVLPFHELTAQLLPKSPEGRLRAQAQVGIENRGNTSASVVLTATDPAERLQHTIKPSDLTLQPGEHAYVDLTVRSRRRLWRGRPKPHPFQVLVADGAGGKPDTLHGSYEQLPLLPGWLFALAATAVALVTMWFALVRPAVQSAARKSVDAQVKQAVQEAVNPPAPQSAPSSGAPKGGASPKAGASGGTAAAGQAGGSGAAGVAGSAPGAVGAGAPGQLSAQLSVTVKPGERGEYTYVVPDGRMMLITDIMADAPQGDEGTLTVSVNGQVVTFLGLENFRHQSAPWVTPIQAPPKSKIVLSVTCRKPGTPPDASASTTCSESVFVSGSASASPADPGH